MPQNKVYRGQVEHKEQVYPGEHHAVVDQELMAQRAGAMLQQNQVEHVSAGGGRVIGKPADRPALR